VGSWINFLIGRFLGEHYIYKWVPEQQLVRFERFLKRQGLFVVLALFIFPGFPKDYLCLFLGVGAMPMKVFLPLAAFGRMPGTLLLSLQGASLFERNYPLLFATLAACLLALLALYRYRERFYAWVDKVNSR
jgi:uncharacterized membrane protein YdjX (TVP38/TMEM64 family)